MFDEGVSFDMTRDGSDVTITNCVFDGDAQLRGGGMTITGTAGRVGAPAPEGELGGGIPWDELSKP